MDEPLVSVVIPLFNAEAWIAETLKSVFASEDVTASDVEVIIVDDGSSDEGAAVVERSRSASPFSVRLLRHPMPQGAAAARNTGWRAARANQVQFLDADDLLAPHKLRLHLDASACVLDAAVLYSCWAPLSQQGGEWIPDEPRDVILGEDPLTDFLGSNAFLQIGSLTVATQALSEVGGFRGATSPVEDVDLYQRIALAGRRFVHVEAERPVLLYRQLAGSFSRRDPQQFALGCLAKAEHVDDVLRASGPLTSTRRDALWSAYFFCARALAPLDTSAFERTVCRLEALGGRVLPPGPKPLRHLSALVGYRRAEKASVRYRRWKAQLAPSKHL